MASLGRSDPLSWEDFRDYAFDVGRDLTLKTRDEVLENDYTAFVSVGEDRMLHEKALVHTPKKKSAPVNFSGKWKNQLGSEMLLTVAGANITGTYTSAVSGGGGSITGALAGHANGDLIAFTVNWPTAAITAWVGQLVTEGGQDVIRTLWQMTTNVEDANEPSGLWASIYAGADRFFR